MAHGAHHPGERLLIISPVFNESEHLDRTARAISAQTRPPDCWIIVDDQSDDDTLQIARDWECRLPYVTVLQTRPRSASEPDGLAIARDAAAFNLGLAHADWSQYSHIGKLDGDVELPPHWYEDLLNRFRTDATLGIIGGRLKEPTHDDWATIPIPEAHVHGAIKLYRRECLEAIGGVPERLGWDTIDETYAQMRGYRTLSPNDLVARHHRHWGSAGGVLRGRARHGECAWILHQPAWWVLLRSAKVARTRPIGLSGVAFAYGYARAGVLRRARVDDREFRRAVRSALRARAWAAAAFVTGRRGVRGAR